MDFGLSVLDISPVSLGSSGAQALRNTLELARLADQLGYERYWLAEHHNALSIASSAPEITIGHVANETERIQVGAGGIMLPNHAPLKVVETFRVLEALHPGRIDLGIGRAPGTDPVTATALRRSQDGLEAEDFPRQLVELLAFSGDGFLEDHPFQSVVAMPSDVRLPPIWLLGTSGYSARMAGAKGFGYAFLMNFSPAAAPVHPMRAMRAYRESFEPSEDFERPLAILAVPVICGETDEDAKKLATSMELAELPRLSGNPGPLPRLPSPEEAMDYPYTPAERRLVDAYRSRQIVPPGDPSTVRARIEELVGHTEADEVMVITNVYDHAERLLSYKLLAEAFGIAPPGK
jgi:luciferase family oxidoreductase group 1